MAYELEVWLANEHVGTLNLIEGRLTFIYTPEWLLRPDAVRLSTSLPLRSEPFGDEKTRPFFAGLLPEGRLRQLIAQQCQVSAQNDFALLDHIGGECAGAVALLTKGQAGLRSGSDSGVRWLSEEEMVAILDELPHRPMLVGQEGLRLSLAGAQDKLPVVFDGVKFGLPCDGGPTSHILKPPIHMLEDTVVNEGFCLALSDIMQLKPAKSKVLSISGRSFLLVERYDRAVDGQGQLQRCHQEDFCQALGVVPEMKYQNEGGPDLKQCFDLVRQVTRPNAPEVLRLFDYVIFNALIGNHDAHGKNFSLLYSSVNPVLAPLYDTLSTAVYPSLTDKMAMKIGSQYKFNEVHARHWEKLADDVSLGRAQARRRILGLAQSMPSMARQLYLDPERGFSGHAVIAKIVALIERRCALTMARMSGA